jgi:hypothetical protein
MAKGARIESIDATRSDSTSEYERWRDEINYAEEELKPFWKRVNSIVKRYKDVRNEYDSRLRKFNIFAANVDSIGAAVYAAPPKVEVGRRFNDADDDVSRVASMLLGRTLEQDYDGPNDPFHATMKSVIFDRLTGSLGQVWLRVEEEFDEQIDPLTGQVVRTLTEREIVIDYVHLSDFLYSPCRIYAQRRWVGRRVEMDRDSLIRRFGSEIGSRIPLDERHSSDRTTREPGMGVENKILQTATIYEIWDRETRTVLWVNKNYPKLLDKRSDFLHLENFEPCPEPLFGSIANDRCIPIPDYIKCQDQYEELNEINNRIAQLIKAVKVRGVYDKSVPAIARVLTEADNNELIPVENWSAFKEKGGMPNMIDWMPLEQIVNAINILRLEKEAKKQEIYELSGYSDIMRGATKATETAAAQKLKANFSSSKIQYLQKCVEEFVARLLSIKAEILVKHFQPQYFIEASNILNTNTDQALLVPAIKLLQNPVQREYTLAIKPESMAQIDYASEKSDRMELLGVVGTYMAKALPLVAQQPMLTDLVIGMLKFAVAGFKAGKEFENILDSATTQLRQYQQAALQAQQNPPPDPQQQKVAMEMQRDQQLHQFDMQERAMDIRAKQQEHALKNKEQMRTLATQLRTGDDDGRENYTTH